MHKEARHLAFICHALLTIYKIIAKPSSNISPSCLPPNDNITSTTEVFLTHFVEVDVDIGIQVKLTKHIYCYALAACRRQVANMTGCQSYYLLPSYTIDP